jgi:hypothetical protein
MPRFLRAVFGPIEITLHHVPTLGHALELHRDGDAVRGFFGHLAELADGWDGSEPLRAAPSL